MDAPEFDSFEDFFPFYVAAHSSRSTRLAHLAGSLTGLAVAAHALVARRPKRIALFPLIGYSGAWFGHFVLEKNTPATFGHPLWSFRGDWKMIAMMLTGRDDELERIAREHLAEVAEASARVPAAA
jgi:hypothetical protein